MSGISIGNLPNQSILKKINDIAADVNDLDLEGVNNLKSKLSELVAPELGSSDTKAISQKVVTENIQQLNTKVNNKINKVESAQNGNLPSFDNGHIKDSKIPASNIAQANGYYESMIVGASRNLAGNNVVTAKYTYRPTADSTDVADGVAKISSVKGNTIVWNQRINNHTPFIRQDISIETINGVTSLNGTITTTYVNIAPIFGGNNSTARVDLNHIGYYKCTIVKDSNNTLQNKTFSLLNRGINNLIVGTTTSFMYKNTDDSRGWGFGFDLFTIGEVLEDIQIKVNIFDLTQMFGEGNEPTLEEFEAMFPNDYYEYNEGELKSIEDFSIKSVGFNQLDKSKWIEANISNGVIIDNFKRNIALSDYIRVLPITYHHNYSITGNARIAHEFDYNKQWLREINLAPNTYTPSEDCSYIRLQLNEFFSKVFSTNLVLNLSHSGIRDGEYEPYQEDILPINISTIKDENGEVLFPNGLCSAGKAHDELVYDKTIGKWKAVKRIGSVDMGTLTWFYDDGSSNSNVYPYGFFGAGISGRRHGRTNILSIKYSYGGFAKDKSIAGNSEDTVIYIKDSAYTDLDSFKASLQGQILYYELAEPIEIVLDDFTSNYKVSDWGTEEILMDSTPIIPVIYDVEYALNAVDTLRNMPTNYISKESLDAFLSALGSAMGGTWTATYNETDGRYDFTFSANASATELIEE